jgi:hydroxymethylpyrimidine/phosphomethylpyrimidine kinase
MRVVMTIAGLDPSGGAGILADLRAFEAFGCFGTTAITSLTSQNTRKVYGAYHQSAEIVRAQIEPVIEEFKLLAVKIGMLPTREMIEVVANIIERHNLPNVVLDPVIRSTSGFDLIDRSAARFLQERLMPLADIITPNMAEAEILTGLEVTNLEQMQRAAVQLRDTAHSAVLVKGGHLNESATDILASNAGVRLFEGKRIEGSNTHGTGCKLSSAIAANLASAEPLERAIERAKEYVAGTLYRPQAES